MGFSFAATLRRVKDDPLGFIDPRLIRAALAKSPKRFRAGGKLPPAKLVPMLLAQAVHGNTALEHLKHLCDVQVSAAAICKQRKRLPLEILPALAVELAATVMNDTRAQANWPHGPGHRVLLVDAFSFSVSNTAVLAEAFGQPAGAGSKTAGKSPDQRKPAFPFGHVLGMLDHHSGLVVDLCVGPGHQHDLHGVEEMHGHLQNDDLLIGDGHFSSVLHFTFAQENKVHLLARASLPKDPMDRVLPRKAPPQMEVVIESDTARIFKRQTNPATWMDTATFASMPREIELREVIYRIEGAGFRSRRLRLLTTLLNAEVYPAEELARLYFKRWQIEVNFRHLKATLKAAVLKGKSEDVVLKELWALVLAYDAVCIAMLEAARCRGVPPSRISFIDALRWLQCYLTVVGGPRVRLGDLVVNPRNLRWWEPRVRFRCHSKYDNATKPRERYHEEREAKLGVPTAPGREMASDRAA